MSYVNRDLCRFYELYKLQNYLDFVIYANYGTNKVINVYYRTNKHIKQFIKYKVLRFFRGYFWKKVVGA